VYETGTTAIAAHIKSVFLINLTPRHAETEPGFANRQDGITLLGRPSIIVGDATRLLNKFFFPPVNAAQSPRIAEGLLYLWPRQYLTFETTYPMIHNRKAAVLTACATLVSAIVATAFAQSVEGDADRGAEQFEATCSECHGPAATAPTLRGIIGRPIASVADFYGYSMALQEKKDLTWTKENLDAYMKSPDTFAPGNLMYRDYPDAQMRADIIAFLETLPPPK